MTKLTREFRIDYVSSYKVKYALHRIAVPYLQIRAC